MRAQSSFQAHRNLCARRQSATSRRGARPINPLELRVFTAPGAVTQTRLLVSVSRRDLPRHRHPVADGAARLPSLMRTPGSSPSMCSAVASQRPSDQRLTGPCSCVAGAAGRAMETTHPAPRARLGNDRTGTLLPRLTTARYSGEFLEGVRSGNSSPVARCAKTSGLVNAMSTNGAEKGGTRHHERVMALGESPVTTEPPATSQHWASWREENQLF